MSGYGAAPACKMNFAYMNTSAALGVSGVNVTNCTVSPTNWLVSMFGDGADTPDSTSSQVFFTYFTPLIFLIGIVGNILSLIVFVSKNMRNLSASLYLAALSTSDLMALVFYVLPEWLKHGMPLLPGHNVAHFLQQRGTCQLLLYLQYVVRFVSSWLVVCFTIERYIGVCHPLRRKDVCNSKSTSRAILGVIVAAASGCAFKPVLSASITAINGDPLCTSDKNHQYLSFVLDSIFGVAITLIPFVLITVLNLLIIRKLVIRNKRHRKIRIVTEESIIRLEFTFILLAISICFVSLNLPYFSVWCRRYWTYRQMYNLRNSEAMAITQHDNHITNLDEILSVTRTIFYINYCINFFLYSITGAYFRKELKHLLLHRERDTPYNRTISAYSRSNSHTTSQSWV